MPAKSSIQSIIEKFKGLQILIIGDVMIDEYLWGNVKRISPEAPVPVVSGTKREYRMGGAGNVAINVKSMDAEPVICSVIGKDNIGKIYRELLAKRNMADEGLIDSDHRITTVKTRVIGNHQHLLRVDHEITDFLDKNLEDLLIKKVDDIIGNKKIDAIIFQDYDKGVLTVKVINEVIKRANSKSIPVLVDPKKRNFGNYHNVALFKPNFKEFTEGLNIEIKKNDFESIYNMSKVLHKTSGIQNVMVTLSELGVFISTGNEYKIIPAEIRDVADVSGAGDTVISIAALCIAAGTNPYQMAALANLAGGLVCEKIGVVPATPEMIINDNYIMPDL